MSLHLSPASLALLSPLLPVTRRGMENPRQEAVAGERDHRYGALRPQSCSGRGGGSVSQALRASPEREASICLSEGKWLFVHV